jgi:kinetochore protein NDC80
MRQDVVSWLQSTEYDISMQTLANITGKEYRNIVQYLFSMLDPGYPFEPQARFEEEFITALKCIRYPFVGQVDPKWLAAPASMHSWPSLLGVLHWLIVMCKVRREEYSSLTRVSYCSAIQGRLYYMESEHPTLQFSGIIPEEFDDPNHHAALAYDYFAESYEAFFAGSDDFADQQRKLEERYGGFSVRIRLGSQLNRDSQKEPTN